MCDDRKTAVAYFTQLKRCVKSSVTLQVVPAPGDGASPEAVLDRARSRLAALRPTPRRGSGGAPGDRTGVWVLLDLERDPAREKQVASQSRAAEASDVRIARSQPCFELWTLLHLIDTGKAYPDCAAVVNELGTQWRRAFGIPLGKKAQADYSKLMPLRSIAVARASSHCHDPSWTEVFLVVQEIEQLVVP